MVNVFKGPFGSVKESVYRSIVGDDVALHIPRRTSHKAVIWLLWLALGLYLACINLFIFANSLTLGTKTVIKIFAL